ncbi:hypothetical protein CNMCM6936_005529 [Aspergillus lentulus]|uniref:Uncharacterized protein n=1 Tax=Aspergillus lentulus TaxID=293939 RepID=A0AAN5YPI4_ASPLE|nr:hypothetical protein CNMCM6069_008398 [Aspergillus lentulus]KAF4167279.1 hypothetical protein CNMCM6936_005529 [Aspergillus lentulus]KAF4173484.1 hypothetical protein CNMCM8060_000062 [Aspergillus lentulus]KAF4193418.1 hypothetical protein CNMCM8694_008946 [Aspergillus lentulus]KAF4204692.1 hypothetical protein CNMCM8927_007199 [Aspergillus lentulus]
MVSAKRKGVEDEDDSPSHQQGKVPGRNRGAKKPKTHSSVPAQTTSPATHGSVLPQTHASVASSNQELQTPETPTPQPSKFWTNELRIALLVAVLKELDQTISEKTWHQVAETLRPMKPNISWNGARLEVGRLKREYFPNTTPAPSGRHDQPAQISKDED